MLEVNGIAVYSNDTAMDALYSIGLNKFDIEDFISLIGKDEIDDAKHEAEVATQEYEAMEAWAEDVRYLMNEVMNICDEALEMGRITKARDRFEAINKLINQYL